MTSDEVVALDLRAASGDLVAARQCRWLATHPEGAQTAEDAVEETALGLAV